jgi:hypothetical protein
MSTSLATGSSQSVRMSGLLEKESDLDFLYSKSEFREVKARETADGPSCHVPVQERVVIDNDMDESTVD